MATGTATPGVVGLTEATTTYNDNIASMVARCNDFLIEAYKSASASIAQLMPFDAARFTAQIESIRKYISSYVVVQPLLDIPKSGPTEKPLDPYPVITEVENQTVNELIALVTMFRFEAANSQSARLPNNLMKFDTARFLSYLDKMDALLAYSAAAEPLDLPESTPDEPITGKGNIGV